jgi:hypothetical protein
MEASRVAGLTSSRARPGWRRDQARFLLSSSPSERRCCTRPGSTWSAAAALYRNTSISRREWTGGRRSESPSGSAWRRSVPVGQVRRVGGSCGWHEPRPARSGRRRRSPCRRRRRGCRCARARGMNPVRPAGVVTAVCRVVGAVVDAELLQAARTAKPADTTAHQPLRMSTLPTSSNPSRSPTSSRARPRDSIETTLFGLLTARKTYKNAAIARA